LQIVEEQVKPERTRRKPNGEFVLRDPLPRRWWHYADKRPALSSALQNVARALAVSQTSKYFSFAFLSPHQIFSHKAVVFPTEKNAFFALMQSRVHCEWSDFFGSSLEDRPVYTPSDCFETFPFPLSFDTEAALGQIGQEYYELRAALMVRNNEGLTKTYNRFHDPDERSPDILRLRELHAAMDRAVLEAYGWHDLAETATYEFLLDYEDDEDDEEEPSGRRRKKPWRYRWPDDFHDEVLARLLDLNQKRAEEERLAGLAAVQATAGKVREAKGKTRNKLTNVAAGTPLFDMKKAGGES
jgi:hypothetical protein